MNFTEVKNNILQEKDSKYLPWLDAEDLSCAFLVQNGLGCQFQLTWKLSIFVLKIEFSSFPPHFPRVDQQKRLFCSTPFENAKKWLGKIIRNIAFK